MLSKIILNMQAILHHSDANSRVDLEFACVTWTTTLVLNSHLSTATRLDLMMITGIPGCLELSQQLLSMDDGHSLASFHRGIKLNRIRGTFSNPRIRE